VFDKWQKQAPFTQIAADPREPVVESSLRALGLPAVTANWKRGEGLGLVSQFLSNEWLTIHEDCADGIREFASYRWATRVDQTDKSRYATSTPWDHHGDHKDALRYAL